jgi:hypothetical protein
VNCHHPTNNNVGAAYSGVSRNLDDAPSFTFVLNRRLSNPRRTNKPRRGLSDLRYWELVVPSL